MKKQILLLTFLSLAFVFAGVNNVFAQTPLPASEATLTPLSCVSEASPLHPVAGVPYTYKMDGTSGEENADTWTWWATKDSVFINASGLNLTTRLDSTASGELLNYSSNYATATTDADSVSITWSSEILNNTEYEGVASRTNFPSPTFVVGYATGNCADNLEVYEINPITAFYIDIANIDEDGNPMAWDADTSQCVDIVRDATYDSANDSLLMNYGADTLYFEIAAAGFVTNWTPRFRVTGGISNSQTATIGLAATLVDAETGNFITGGENTWTSGDVGASGDWDGPALTANDPADISTGVSVWARVIIENNTFESLSTQTFALAVDAVDGSGQWDMENTDCSVPSNAAADQEDLARHNILPRPTINHNTADPATSPEPDTIIDKQRQ